MPRDLANVNQWNTGFQAAITIQNTGTIGITSWKLSWTFPNNQHITSLWNGSYIQSGETVTVDSLSYNGSVPVGSSYNGVGFTANYSGTNTAPSAFTINGVACR
jgi:cellulase/cellobiase CelA1